MEYPLATHHATLGAVLRPEGDGSVPAHYGRLAAEYTALVKHAGIVDLSARGCFAVGGRDRTTFINGWVSQHVKPLVPGTGVTALFLTPQGRVIADVTLDCLPDEFWLTTEPAASAIVHKKLSPLVRAGDFRLTDLRATHALLGLVGPAAPALIESLTGAPLATWRTSLTVEKVGGGTESLPVFAHERLCIGHAGVLVVQRPRYGQPAFDLFVLHEAAVEVWTHLTGAGATPVGWDALEVCRIEHGTGRFGQDFDETTLAPEAGLGHAISYTKGCYVGQETVAKIHWRGHDQTARRLTPLRIASDTGTDTALPGKGTPILADGKEVGQLTSVVRHPVTQEVLALGYLRSAVLAQPTALVVDGRPVHIREGAAA
ncbi:CAF17-like 4Fe-4S cluster assembly/insertion protein YgfZ [Chloracidobacterium thermophilum]|jgi:folate-binding protein YgfZ|uniref:Folate-binding protein YgfZ n=1 Tax=Chloracidobacterium thermophilum (strain B) TaxID=981222 RepID=G2LEB6_CHLTF|nr:glycine cleavage T C-terminal barrel domain-containing protein [Chloracidobacterium thermophilum]AEP11336.1 folate-binding protein YgfZ [Chloracidobacterium thermophilum B]QUV79241.1 aminomethyltransferase family protein [Chloracidobacterium thermophilum]